MRRAQAAVEFLMTYGWALLGILLVVSVIVYFGVIDPNMFVPERCELGYRLACKDYMVSKSLQQVNFLAVNNFPEGIYITEVKVFNPKFSAPCVLTIPGPSNAGGILVGEVKAISVPCSSELSKITSSKKVSFDVNITYYLNGTGFPPNALLFPLYGEIYTRLS